MNEDLRAYSEYQRRRDELVSEFGGLVMKLDGYDLNKIPMDIRKKIYEVINQFRGSLHQRSETPEDFMKVNDCLTRDIKQLEEIYKRMPSSGEKNE